MAQTKEPRKPILIRLPVKYYDQIARLAEKKLTSLGSISANLVIETLDARATSAAKGSKK